MPRAVEHTLGQTNGGQLKWSPETVPLSVASLNLVIQETREPKIFEGSLEACNICDSGGNLIECSYCAWVFHSECLDAGDFPYEFDADNEDWACPTCWKKALQCAQRTCLAEGIQRVPRRRKRT